MSIAPSLAGSRRRPATTYHAPRLLLWSGRDADEERAARTRLLDEIDRLPPRRVLHRGAPGRTAGVRAAVVTTTADAARDVAAATAQPARSGGPRPVALLLPGQGCQHAGMAVELYRHEPVFRAAVDDTLRLWGPDGNTIRSDWLGTTALVDLNDTRRAQPLIFAIDHALGRLVSHWGVDVTAMLGHSAGEVAAATLAGVFTLPEAVALFRDRIRSCRAIAPGGMVAVAATEAEVRPHLVGAVAVAAVNAARQVMLAGPTGELAAIVARLDEAGLTVRTVPASTPFHSPAMAPAVAEAERSFAAAPRAPERTVYSGYTGNVLTAADVRNPSFWARQLADTVYFGPALSTLLAHGDRMLLEAGPGQALTAFARRQRAVRRGASSVLPLLPGGAPDADRRSVLSAVAALWVEGHALDLDAF